jgi:hypothetical protein
MILAVVERSEGNTQAYALNSLHAALTYVSGMAAMASEDESVAQLYRLLHSPVITVVRPSLELLFALVDFSNRGFDALTRAAKTIALERREVIFAVLASLLGSEELDIKVNVLTLVNTLLRTAPKKKKPKLLLRLEDAGITAKKLKVFIFGRWGDGAGPNRNRRHARAGAARPLPSLRPPRCV